MKIILKRVLKENSQSGFSLLESMVAAMISLVFISMGANLVLAANIQKAMAKRNAVMNNFVQSNLDEIKYQASLLTADPDNKCNVAVDANSYAAALMTQIGATSTPTPTTIKVLNRNYIMTRTTGISTTDNRLLTVSYDFRLPPAPNTTPVSEYNLYTEIMPAAAFDCPAPAP